ncbi:MAG: DUF1249 domain-containing protein, partial [Gammaproteobacteria bacterium]|nr:DUF1249 domain-containing protein [Gammaproteobacteria bacterium]
MSAFMKPARYVPNLGRLGALCEANYQRLVQLMRLADENGVAGFSLHARHQYVGQVTLQRLQRSRYTETLLLEQIHAQGPWLNNPRMTVRVYHDARMAEVISCFRHARIDVV